MSDGYRVLLGGSKGKPFINFKVERSSPAFAASDREAVEQQMQAFSARRAPNQKEMIKASHDGVEVLSIHQPDLKPSGPVSLYSIMVPAKSIIATVYVMNQAPDGGQFTTYSDYEALRDQAAKFIRSCIAASGA